MQNKKKEDGVGKTNERIERERERTSKNTCIMLTI